MRADQRTRLIGIGVPMVALMAACAHDEGSVAGNTAAMEAPSESPQESPGSGGVRDAYAGRPVEEDWTAEWQYSQDVLNLSESGVLVAGKTMGDVLALLGEPHRVSRGAYYGHFGEWTWLWYPRGGEGLRADICFDDDRLVAAIWRVFYNCRGAAQPWVPTRAPMEATEFLAKMEQMANR